MSAYHILMCDTDYEPHASWKPDVGKVFCGHGPGMTFVPDGNGGGTLSYVIRMERKGFRPRNIQMIVKKQHYTQ